MPDTVTGHAGEIAVAVARAHGVETMFTLSGAHVFPLYDGAVRADPPMRLVDVRHEATAVFAAEGLARLTRRPGLAVLTAGPGVTNGVSAVTTAHFNGSPLLVLGGRAPAEKWGQGSLQELDHPPLLAPVTKYAGTISSVDQVAAQVGEALRLATTPHRGPVFLDIPFDVVFAQTEMQPQTASTPGTVAAEEADVAAVAAAIDAARRPVLVLSSDVWTDGAADAARRCAEQLRLPVITTGMGRGILPRGHELLVTRARSAAFNGADLVVVAGAPLDFRLGYGRFGGKDGATPASVVHLADSPGQLARHVTLAASAAGDMPSMFDAITATVRKDRRDDEWLRSLREAAAAAEAADADLLASDADPIHPARIYGELRRALDDDAVVIGDGGDFVSFAGRFVEPARPGHWLDPGPFGCLGTGAGYAIAARLAHPSSQVVLLLGDGAAGFSLMDVDTLVRHQLPVVVVVGNNSVWGLEKGPMQMIYGYDVAADLGHRTRYDDVVRALGGAGEMVTTPAEIGPALRRGFAAAAPYLINVITDPDAAYPRSTFGV
ncbi:MAG TPA: acetolactate synthase [Mycobacteriales bacterium]|jgi:acetolactate synthase-1/2/3 large subunit|nr:acetolactate synthase [Mycobacteriales bacterium]